MTYEAGAEAADGPVHEPEHSSVRSGARSLSLVLPSRTDPIAAAATAVIGGPAGRRLAIGRRRFGPGGGLPWIVAVLSLLAGVVLGLGVLQKQHCRSSGWNSPDQFWHACYSDTAVLYGSAGLGRPNPPSVVDVVGPDGLGQPPLTSVAMWVVSKAVDGRSTVAARHYFDLSAVVLAVALAVAVACVVAAAGRRPWDAAHVALAPMLVTAGLISYDLLAVALTAASLLAWSRRRPVLGGVLLGLAMSCRPVTAAVLLAVVALGVRTGLVRAPAGYVLPAVATWLGLRVVLLPGSTGDLVETYRGWRRSSAGYGSFWFVPQLLGQSEPSLVKNAPLLHRFWYDGGGLGPAWTTLGVLLLLVFVAVVTLWLGLGSPDRPRLAHLALFAVAGTLVVGKSVPVQSTLLLLPLVALAGLRWRDHLIWAGTELAYFVAVWLYIGFASDPNKGLPPGAYIVLLLARIAGIGWIMAQAVRGIRDPLVDPVRVPVDGSPGADDPLGGPLDGAPDAFVVRLV